MSTRKWKLVYPLAFFLNTECSTCQYHCPILCVLFYMQQQLFALYKIGIRRNDQSWQGCSYWELNILLSCQLKFMSQNFQSIVCILNSDKKCLQDNIICPLLIQPFFSHRAHLDVLEFYQVVNELITTFSMNLGQLPLVQYFFHYIIFKLVFFQMRFTVIFFF